MSSMTTRDRLVVIGLGVAAILAAFWFLLVTPARKEATQLSQQVASAQQTLSSAQEKLDTARAAETKYQSDYAAVVKMGEAVPPSPEVPSLVYELDQLSNSKNVEFASITSSGSGSGSKSTASASSTPAAAPAGFQQLPFTFTFKGSFFALYKLLNRLDGLAAQTEKGVEISGRLLTIQSASLTGSGSGQETKGGAEGKKSGELAGTITATAYVLPASQGLTAGATPAGPAGTAGGSQPASSPGGSSPTPTAEVRP
jgi:type II secretion system (T2SS) protein M